MSPAASPSTQLSARPRDTSELLGHEAAEHAFLSAWNGGRLAHAWLITGPRGIGKATLAFRIARFVLSQGHASRGAALFQSAPDSLAMGPDHAVFRRVASGGHADLRIIDRESETSSKTRISVESVRGIGSFLSLTPAEGGWRVVILDALDDLNQNGANALLKILEEPPADALILLTCHSPGRVLPTIRSRCRRLALKPLSQTNVIELISRRIPELPPADAQALAHLSEGSIGKALALQEEGGLELYGEMLDHLAKLPSLDVQGLHRFADRLGRDQASFRTLGELFASWLARAIGAAGGSGGVQAATPNEIAASSHVGGSTGLDRWLDLWEKTCRSFERAEAINLDRKQVVLSAFLAVQRLCRA